MTTGFLITTLLFVVVSVVMILVILVQRPQGGGLAGAFGGAGGGGGTESVFGGRVGDALTWSTVIIFVLYLSIAIGLNLIESAHTSQPAGDPTRAAGDPAPTIETESGEPIELTPMDAPPEGFEDGLPEDMFQD